VDKCGWLLTPPPPPPQKLAASAIQVLSRHLMSKNLCIVSKVGPISIHIHKTLLSPGEICAMLFCPLYNENPPNPGVNQGITVFLSTTAEIRAEGGY
jgi:hypothetical protein